MNFWVEIIGMTAAIITTLGWVPQILKLAKERKADNISLLTTGSLAIGVLLWAIYGLCIGSWPVIIANMATLLFIGTIIAMKLKFG